MSLVQDLYRFISILLLLSNGLFTSRTALASARSIPPQSHPRIPALRVIAVGDSITKGVGSTTGDGYRGPLLQLFDEHNVQATYLGTQHTGQMANNAHEAYPSYPIANITKALTHDERIFSDMQKLSPNLILLHVGSNNWQNTDDFIPQYHDLLATIQVLAPDALVMLASIIPSLAGALNERIDIMNEAIVTDVIPSAANLGSKIFYVDMAAAMPKSAQYYDDPVHPNNRGYARMAEVWWFATRVAVQQGLVDPL